MSSILSKLLTANEPQFTFGMAELEKISGHTSVDVRLVSDIATMVSLKIKELTLDPNDTTGKELYHALQAMVALHDSYLSNAIGIKQNDALDKQLFKIKDALNKLPIAKSCWVIKHSVAKRIIKTLPPKKVMKILNYKSVDSLIKRENINELFSAIRFCESDSYQQKIIKSYKKLKPSDFEIREIEVLCLDKDKWGNAADNYIYKKHYNITHLKELGVVMLLPIPVRRLRGLVITVMPLAIHYINEIRSYNSYFKLQQVHHNFGQVYSETILKDPNSKAKIGNHELHWRIIQRHFGTYNTSNPELFEPHVQIEDLYWRKAEEEIFKIEPALKFWENLDYVARIDDNTVIPFNLMDNAVSYCNHLEYGEHSVGYFRESLWNEIYLRYLGIESVEKLIVNQLNSKNNIEMDIM